MLTPLEQLYNIHPALYVVGVILGICVVGSAIGLLLVAAATVIMTPLGWLLKYVYERPKYEETEEGLVEA